MLDPPLRWVLARAFGPNTCFEGRRQGERELGLARRLDLSARIGGRLRLEQLEEELGHEQAVSFKHDHLATAAREGVFERSVTLLAEIARETGTPLVLLKHAALRAARITKPGWRRAGDVDVLVPARLARPFYETLSNRGYRWNGTRAYEHQLPQLLDPYDTLIEIHRHIPGLQLPGADRFVTADDLLNAGLVTREGGALVPAPAVLAAHAVAHGLLQNAGAPRSSSPLRIVADCIDLLERDPRALVGATRLLSPVLDAQALETIGELTELFARGAIEEAKGNVRKLFCHMVASQLDDDYERRLSLLTITRPLSQHARWRASLNAAFVALFPDRTAMTLLYGGSRSSLERGFFRLTRPLVLLSRTVRALGRRPRT